MRVVWTLICVFSLSSCASNDQARLSREISRTVSPGQSAFAAQKALRDEGFDCRETDRGVLLTCTRQRSHRIIASCVQGVTLSVAEDRIDNIEVWIACASV